MGSSTPLPIPRLVCGPGIRLFRPAASWLPVPPALPGRTAFRETVTGPLAALVPEPTQEFTMLPVDETGDLFVVT
jgi:hypothetical protein